MTTQCYYQKKSQEKHAERYQHHLLAHHLVSHFGVRLPGYFT